MSGKGRNHNNDKLRFLIKQEMNKHLEEASSRSRRFTALCYELMSVAVLHDKLDMPEEKVKEYLQYMELYATYISDDALNIQELYQQLKENGALNMTSEELCKLDPVFMDYLEHEEE
jgi:predicted solute-binding protein